MGPFFHPSHIKDSAPRLLKNLLNPVQAKVLGHVVLQAKSLNRQLQVSLHQDSKGLDPAIARGLVLTLIANLNFGAVFHRPGECREGRR